MIIKAIAMEEPTPAEAWVLRSLVNLFHQGTIGMAFAHESLPNAVKHNIKQKVLKSLVAKGWLTTDQAPSGESAHSFFPYETDPFHRYMLTPAALTYLTQDSAPEQEHQNRHALAVPRAQLYQSMLQYCSASDIYDLCFELGIDHEQFPHKKHDLIRELITYVKQSGRLQELIDALGRLRPDLNSVLKH